MKRLSAIALLCISAILVSCSNDTDDPAKSADSGKTFKFAIIADPHAWITGSVSPKKVFEDFQNRTVLKIDRSKDILEGALRDISYDESITHVIVIGDITMYGEKESMKNFLEYMEWMKAVGKTVIILPGKNDIENDGYYVDSKKIYPNETIEYEWFKNAYKDYYPPSVIPMQEFKEGDLHDQIYIYDPIDNIRFMFITQLDSCRTSQTDNYIKEQLEVAKSAGKKVIVFMNQNILPQFNNWDQLSAFLPAMCDSPTPNYLALEKILNDGNVRAAFTAGSQATNSTKLHGSNLWDVATGSLTAIGNAYRVCSIEDEKLTITTKNANTWRSGSFSETVNYYLELYRYWRGPYWVKHYSEMTGKNYDLYLSNCQIIGSAIAEYIYGDEAYQGLVDNKEVNIFMIAANDAIGDFVYNLTNDPDGNLSGLSDHNLSISLK